jgi:hypothetical protein
MLSRKTILAFLLVAGTAVYASAGWTTANIITQCVARTVNGQEVLILDVTGVTGEIKLVLDTTPLSKIKSALILSAFANGNKAGFWVDGDVISDVVIQK